MIDDKLIPTVRAEGSLHGAGDGSAGVDIAKNSAIFGVVAVVMSVALRQEDLDVGILLVALLEQPAVGRIGHRQRHFELMAMCSLA